MKKRILALSMVLALLAVMVMPAAALAQTQTVTGSTLPGYTITEPVEFGPIAAGGTATTSAVISATSDSVVTVTVAKTTVNYVIGRLVGLQYDEGGVAQVIITAPLEGGADRSYSLAPTEGAATIAAGASWDLTATAGTVSGVWDPVVITLTIV